MIIQSIVMKKGEKMKILKSFPTEEQKIEIVNLFIESFLKIFKNLKIFSKNKKKIFDYLFKNLNYQNIICAVEEGKIVGILGFKNINKPSIDYNKSNFIKAFGYFSGYYKYLKSLIISFFECSPKKDEVLIEMICVSSEFRSKGIGSFLINELFDIGKKENKSKILLEVVNTNPRAKSLYEKLGFQVKKKTNFGFLTKSSGFTSVEFMVKEI